MTGRAMALNIGTPIVLSVCRLAALLIALAGCSAGGRPKEKNIDPNAYPTTYEADLLAYLQNHGSEMENAREAYIFDTRADSVQRFAKPIFRVLANEWPVAKRKWWSSSPVKSINTSMQRASNAALPRISRSPSFQRWLANWEGRNERGMSDLGLGPPRAVSHMWRAER